ncbi:MAG TPA: hypothetical protein VGG30_12015, partial [Pirellulales bacterium]
MEHKPSIEVKDCLSRQARLRSEYEELTKSTLRGRRRAEQIADSIHCWQSPQTTHLARILHPRYLQVRAICREAAQSMMTRPQKMQSLGDLRQFVHESLCAQNELERGVFPMTERILLRGG